MQSGPEMVYGGGLGHVDAIFRREMFINENDGGMRLMKVCGQCASSIGFS
jgi:hypothetical protein